MRHLQLLISFVALLLLALLVVGACRPDQSRTAPPPPPLASPLELGTLYQDYYDDPTTAAQRDQNAIIDYIAEHNLEVLRSPSGLYYSIAEMGAGASYKRGDRVTADYRGYLLNGEVFDSSYDKGRPMTFTVGTMISGFDEVCYYMRPGGKVTVLVPSRLGYGRHGLEGVIAPDTPLAFDIHYLPSSE